MRLSELLKDIEVKRIIGEGNPEIKGIACDSRKVNEGDLFVAIKGFKTDGHLFLKEALSKGAVAFVVEKENLLEISQVLVEDSRQALANLSNAFFNYPSQKLKVLGVTGTNGKTTTSFLLESILRKASLKTGLLSTVKYEILKESFKPERTTPESLDLQRFLYEMCQKKVEAVVMEVSSHAIDLHRLEGTSFHGLVFTNLSPEHLDYHPTLEAYFQVKKRIFQKNPQAFWVINIDSSFGRRIYNQSLQRTAETFTYGFKPPAQVRAEDIEPKEKGTTFKLVTPQGEISCFSSLSGLFNVYNHLAAAASALALNLSLPQIKEGLEKLNCVPGRFEEVSLESKGFKVIVDYAHTPQALENVLRAARDLTKGKVITVFGCGGDRDRQKRPLMGQVSANLSDLTILTTDNPRSEPPEAIIVEIEKGLKKVSFDRCLSKVIDRKEAIFEAISLAKKGDVVLIAGKGHEDTQEFSDKIVPFDDREVARQALHTLVRSGKELNPKS